jgi:hypothetical protein
MPRGASGPAKKVIRLSDRGVCHPPESPNYDQLRDYRTFATIDECIAAGGRPITSN